MRALRPALLLSLPLHTLGCSADAVSVLKDAPDSATPSEEDDTADTAEPVVEPDPDPYDRWLETELLPGGSFEMGCTRPEEWPCGADESPVRTLRLSPFEIMRTEVPRGMYRALTGGAHRPEGCTQDDCVAVQISWLDAVAFCNLVSDADGLPRAYAISGTEVSWDPSADGWRLPTEAEWEYAARGGRDLVYSGSGDLDLVAWTQANANGRPREIAQKAQNDFGLHDMSGNAWEWVWDWQGAYESADTSNPTGPESGTGRVRRGGAWDEDGNASRVSFRSALPPGSADESTGLRLVRGALER